MSDAATKSHPRRAVEVLTRANHERWFRQMEHWLIGEELWEVVDPANGPISLTPASTPTGSISEVIDVTEDTGVASYGRVMNLGFGGTIAAARKLDARARYQISNCIDEDDEEMIAEETRARGAWKRLVKKYKSNLQTTGRQFLAELVNYKKDPALDIQATYTEISKKSRKLVELQPELKIMATPARRFQTLLQSLPDEYSTTRDAIDAQTPLDVDTSLQKLLEKEAQLQAKEKEVAMWAKDNKDKDGHGHNRDRQRFAYRIPQRRRSTSSSNNDHRPHRRDDKSKPKGPCFLCDEPHRIADCPLLRQLRKLAKSLMKKGDHKESKLVRSKSKAYNANDSPATSSAESLEFDSNNEEDMEEIAALSKELVSTVPKSDWIADTGATSHMTDQLRLFSGPLTSIKRRTIKVGGGRLYSDQCGTVVMKVQHGECRLTEVLYVPDLGVNLLSGRRFTRCGLRGSFNNNGLYIHTKKGVEVLRAPTRGGIYIVDKVASELDEFALSAVTASNSEPASFVSAALPAATDSDEFMSDSEPQELNIDSDPKLIRQPEGQPESASASQQPRPETQPEAKANPMSKRRDMFNLWHRRLGHLGSAKLRSLHKVTTLKKPIPIVESDDPCNTTSWMSRKQKSVATSTTEAEYMALSTCVKEGLWIAQLLRDLELSKYLGTELGQVAIAENVKHKVQSPMQLYGDKQAANLLVKNAHISERSKHIDVAYHHVRDTLNKNLIQLSHLSTNDMVADGLTKPLLGDKHKNFVDLLGLKEPKVSGSRVTHNR